MVMANNFSMTRGLVSRCSVCDEVNEPEILNRYEVSEEEYEASVENNRNWKGVMGYRIGAHWSNCICESCFLKAVKGHELITKNKLRHVEFEG